MTFDERAAIQLRMQQIFQEREKLQAEYDGLFTRLRQIDQRDPSIASAVPVEELGDKQSAAGREVANSQFPDMGNFDTFNEKEIDTKEFDQRLDQLQQFLEKEED
ncbi:hypothetical protein [Desertibacillus haloalkaliphilus]|uniref:hypothetical protein n=1 Tax=Desertibacillus haloalkaliphilus TaxID=1328930 RepID=UPI001C26D468|nr:hypothetical protein [Desertibacillus haloalkaliphilus]MBU8906505.1 hypothetical protein [Desertibacillus haloalkaliphilus]